MQSRFVLEFNVRAVDGRLLPPAIIPAEEYGFELFVAGQLEPGAVVVDHNIDGMHHGTPVTYSRALVILVP